LLLAFRYPFPDAPTINSLDLSFADLTPRSPSSSGVGWYQEKQAGDIVSELKAGIALKAFVVRGGKEVEVEAREVVPGDIVSVFGVRIVGLDWC
jgi:hypothetical protein